MKFMGLGQDAAGKSDSPVSKLNDALDNAERKLAERELLLAAAIDQTETARAQYEQANTRAETLRRHLNAKEEQLSALQLELRQRDDRIATLERASTENNKAQKVSKDEVKRPQPPIPSDQLAAMGLALASLEQPVTLHKITNATTTIGRSASNDIAIHSQSVSRFHARIVVEAEGVFLIDLESTNGCKVNGERITRQMIGDADDISIGHMKFKFSIGAPSAEAEARAMAETHVLLDDSVILVPAPTSTTRAKQ